MQSQQDTTDADVSKRYGHRRTPTLGKTMPVTSLLLNCPPPTMSTLRSSCMRDGRTPDEERPPLFFQLESRSASVPPSQLEKIAEPQITNVKPTDSAHSSSDDINLEQEYDLLVSECSSGTGDGDRQRNEPRISLVGNSIFYTPCLTCTDSAPDDMSARQTAINEMCRRLCTDECRLRLSLAGFEPPSTATLKSREALAEYVKETTCLKQQRPQYKQTCSEDTICAEPLAEGVAMQEEQQSVDDIDRVSVATKEEEEEGEEEKLVMCLQTQASTNASAVKTSPIVRPPSCIAIQRKKFLTDILMINANDTDSDSSFADEQKEIAKVMSKSFHEALTLPEAAARESVEDTTLTKHSDYNVDAKPTCSSKVDLHEMTMLNDFREKFEIAEALAKTSAMTSTVQMKQRLAARQLEITSANSHAKAAAAAAARTSECLLPKQKREKSKKDKLRRQQQREQQKKRQVVEQQQQEQQCILQKGVPASCAPALPLHDALTHSDNAQNNKTKSHDVNVASSCKEGESVCNEGVDSGDDDNDEDDDDECDEHSDNLYDNGSDSDMISDSDNDFDFGVTGIDDVSTSQQQQQSQVSTSNDFEPPRDLLLYLVR